MIGPFDQKYILLLFFFKMIYFFSPFSKYLLKKRNTCGRRHANEYVLKMSGRYPNCDINCVHFQFHYKYMVKNQIHSKTHYINPIVSVSCHLRAFQMTWAQFFVSDLVKGHSRSPKVTNTFLSITRDRATVETHNRCRSVCLVETHLCICNLTELGHIDLDPGPNF